LVRLLGYSSVAHAGFILVPFAMAARFDADGLGDAMFGSITYLLVYAFMNLGAFGIVMAGASRTGSAEMEDWAGLAKRAPGIAGLLAVFFFSLAGIPPLAGWFAKFVMFRAVLGVSGDPWGVTLAVIAALNAVVALFYYARVIKTAFMDPAPEGGFPAAAPLARPLVLALGISLTVVVVAGFFPQVLAFLSDAGRALALGP
jgi:NADH-quinone oxidoreductase subunit N